MNDKLWMINNIITDNLNIITEIMFCFAKQTNK